MVQLLQYKLNHVIMYYLDGGTTEADSRASALVGPSVAMPLLNKLHMGTI